MNKDTGLWVFSAPFGTDMEIVYIGNDTDGWEVLEDSSKVRPTPSQHELSGSYLNLSGMLSSGKIFLITAGDVEKMKEFIE